jgi:hypothetical protein
MHAVLQSYGRALLAQLNVRLLLLSLAPFVLSVALWGGLLWLGLQPLLDLLQGLFTEHDGFAVTNSWLGAIGLGALKTVVVPLIAMLMLLPLMILTALIFIGVAAMPAVVRYVGRRQFPALEQRRGGSLLGSVTNALAAFGLFALFWLLALPLYVIPPLALLAQVGLWGWLTSRVMAYDALADYASAEERATLLQVHRWPLLVIGAVSGVAGALPGIVWVGGTVMSVVLFPLLAALSIWLYVVVFTFSGLWYSYYCLQALDKLRETKD